MCKKYQPMSILIAAIASGGDAKPRTPNRPIAPYDFRVSPRQRPVGVAFDPFAKPSINDRYLRKPAGWS